MEDSELKYGLSVTGFVHSDRILTKKNLNAGDRLVLAKPLGTGHRYEIGRGKAQGTKLNLPLRPGDGDDEFFTAWEEGLSHLRRYRPEFFILQCGADGLAGDPMTDLRYTPAVHARIARDLRKLAEEMCDGRLMAFGRGGYNPDNVVAAWMNTLTAII